MAVAGACASVASIALIAQQQPPRFQTGIELTRLEITVLHKDTRKPIRGLKPEDFVVKVDGKVQRVATLAEVDAPGPSAAPAAAFVEAAFDVTANDRPRPRVFVILMNDASGGNDPFTRQTGIAIGHRLIDSLGPEDMAGVVFARDNRYAQDLTADRTLLRRAVERFRPLSTIGISPLRVLQRTQAFLARMTGHRRALMFVSPVIFEPVGDRSRWANAAAVDPNLSAVSTAARVSAVPIYVFGTDGLLAPTPDDLRGGRVRNRHDQEFTELARTIGSLTGGRAVVETNAPAKLVPAVFEELSTYYVLAYENTYPADGRHRWLQVEVAHPDAMVMKPRTLIAPGRSARAARRRVVDRPEDSGLLEAIAAPLPAGDLPLRLSNVAVAVPKKREQAVALTLGLPPVPPGNVEHFRVRLMLFDSEGRRELLTQAHDVKVPGREMSPGELNEMVLRLALRPERYHLRIAVEQVSTRRAGSVHATLIVPNFERETLSLSGVALLRSGGVPAGGREALADLLPSVPTAVRVFTRADRVAALMRLHQSIRRPAEAVVLETEILDAAGDQVHASTRALDASAFATNAAAEHRFDLPLASLEPGDYLLRFIASSGKNRAQREVRFSVVR